MIEVVHFYFSRCLYLLINRLALSEEVIAKLWTSKTGLFPY